MTFEKIDRLVNIKIKSNGLILRKKWEGVYNYSNSIMIAQQDPTIETQPTTEAFRKPSYNSSFRSYRKRVRILTEKVAHLIPGIEKRGFRDYHIDHIISIWKGFKLGICEHKIADLSNLRMLHYEENMLKGIR